MQTDEEQNAYVTADSNMARTATTPAGQRLQANAAKRGAKRREALSDSQVSDMIKNYPALTVKTAQKAMDQAGLDSSDPQLAMQMLGTQQFKDAARNTVDTGGDDLAIQQQIGRDPNLPDLNDPLGKRTTDLFQEREDFQVGQNRATSILAQRVFEATQKANQLADFDETAFKTKRLKELDPTADLDDQIMKLRFRQMKEEADIRSNPNFSHLSPAAKQRLIDTNRQENNETIGGIREMRDLRLQNAESQIDGEISSHNNIIKNAKSRIADWKAMEDLLEKTGESNETLFDIREKRQKAEKDLQKQQDSGKGPASSAIDIIESLILKEVEAQGHAPTSVDLKAIRKKAEEIAKQRQQQKDAGSLPSAGNVAGAGGITGAASSIIGTKRSAAIDKALE